MTDKEMDEITISEEVKNELDKLRKEGETYQEVIAKLIEDYSE